MNIAITSTGNDLGAAMDLRFGRAAKFIIYDTDQTSFEVINNAHIDADQGAGLKAAETIVNAGAKILVTGDCGPKAFNALKQAGITIYSCKNKSVQNAIDLFLANELQEITAP